MTAEEFRESGLAKLTELELAALSTWLAHFTLKVLTSVGSTEGTPGQPLHDTPSYVIDKALNDELFLIKGHVFIAKIRSIFNAPDRVEADRRLHQVVEAYRDSSPRLSAWVEANVPEGLTVFELPAEHRIRLRTTNSLELLNKTLKRRTRVAALFPNAGALLRLVSAILIEVSEEWETGKLYLNMESR